MTSVSCFFDEVSRFSRFAVCWFLHSAQFVGTVVLLLVVCAINDKNNGPPPPGLVPLVLFITVLGIGASLGFQTGYAINPARDLGPRILTSMVGYGSAGTSYRRTAFGRF